MLNVVKNFPVPTIGVVASVLAVVVQALESSPSWEAAVPAVASALAALFVTPSYRVSSNNYVIRSTPEAEDGYVSWQPVVVAVVVVIVLFIVLPGLFGSR